MQKKINQHFNQNFSQKLSFYLGMGVYIFEQKVIDIASILLIGFWWHFLLLRGNKVDDDDGWLINEENWFFLVTSSRVAMVCFIFCIRETKLDVIGLL